MRKRRVFYAHITLPTFFNSNKKILKNCFQKWIPLTQKILEFFVFLSLLSIIRPWIWLQDGYAVRDVKEEKDEEDRLPERQPFAVPYELHDAQNLHS